MKKTGIYLLTCLIIFSACGKHDTVPNPNQTLIFGQRCVVCWFSTSNFYQVKNSSLYQDTTIYHSVPTTYNFSKQLPYSKYLLASPLLNNFPQYLRNDTGGNLACPGCLDGPVMYLEFTDGNNHTVKWDINFDTSFLPAQIRPYIQQVKTVMGQL